MYSNLSIYQDLSNNLSIHQALSISLSLDHIFVSNVSASIIFVTADPTIKILIWKMLEIQADVKNVFSSLNNYETAFIQPIANIG